ncbi:hypothetical protein ACFPMF_18840 [Larkinella bovis]|uniref:Lipocalin-like domain-containing protein n=1 Tax=Larkinella bovis TaxID=683041 RepID=A0ABW0IDA8_9BACT
MKTLAVFLPLLVSALASFGQCDQEVKITTSKTEYLDNTGAVQRSVDEQSTIEIGKTEIKIWPGNADRVMTGKIESNTCAWSVPYKEGRTVMKAVFSEDAGQQLHATITLEGKAEKITFQMEVQERPDRVIRVSVTTFEAKK